MTQERHHRVRSEARVLRGSQGTLYAQAETVVAVAAVGALPQPRILVVGVVKAEPSPPVTDLAREPLVEVAAEQQALAH